MLTGLLLLTLLLAACSSSSPAAQDASTDQGPAITENPLIADLDAYAFPTPTPTAEESPLEEPEETLMVVVNTQGARANLRAAPTLESEIIGKGNPGSTWEVVGQSEDGAWYQICCVQGAADAEGQPTTPAWVASSVVSTTTGIPEQQAVVNTEPVLEDGLEATWEVDWECRSDRCAIPECKATVTATADSPEQQYLQVEHNLTWEDACFDDDSWIFEVDRYTGRERTGDFANNFLYSYWMGSEPGEPNGVYRYSDDKGIAVWCTEEEDVEIEEGNGWTTIYEGSTCHDVKTGALILLEYTKRWLYTGEYDGNTYNRAYFGDSETLEQRLVDTNIDMEFVTPVE